MYWRRAERHARTCRNPSSPRLHAHGANRYADEAPGAMNVAVIGAGYAGMAAAVALVDAGVPVTVYEAGAAPGGRARRVEVHGMPLDNGIHILIGAYRDTLAAIRKVGVAPDHALLRLPLDWDIHRHFRFSAAPLPAPLHLAAGLLAVRGASWRDRWSAARFLSAMRRVRYRLERDCSVAALLHASGQSPSFMRHLWEPLCLAALNTPIETASAQVFLNVLRDGLDADRSASDVLLVRSDLGALFPDPACRHVREHGGEVRLRVGVRAIERAGSALRVYTREGSRDYSHVVCATSPHNVAALLGRISDMDSVVADVEQMRYEPIYTVYLQYDAALRLPKPMLGLADRTAHWLFDRGVIAGQQGLVAGIISAGGSHAGLAHEALARRVDDDVRHVVSTAPPLAWWRVIAEKRATFACTVDVRRPAHRTPVDGLLLAGDYTAGEYPGTLEAAVRSGLACARAVLA